MRGNKLSDLDQEELIKLIEEDIEKLKTHLITDLNEFELTHIQQSEFDILNFNLLIDLEFFEEAVNASCYELRSPVFTTIGPDLSRRLELFTKFFLSKFSRVTRVTIIRTVSRQSIGDFEQSLFILLLFALFQKHLITGGRISEIFQNCLDQWNYSLNTNKIPVKVLVQMPNIECKKDYEMIKDKVYLKSTKSFTILSEKMGTTNHCTLLVYKTELSSKIYTSIKELNSEYKKYRKIFEAELDELSREIQDIVFAFYFNLVDFDYEEVSMIYPKFLQNY